VIKAPQPAKEKRKRSADANVSERFSFSGHQSFALRIAWLPKSVDALSRGKDPFKDPRVGTQILGLGKNMVEALRYWVQFFGVVRAGAGDAAPEPTEFGKLVFGPEGHDRFLEDEQTLWLLHWQGTAASVRPFFAWHWMFNLHLEPEFTYSEAVREFSAYCATYSRPLSDATIRQHLDVFLATYVATEPAAGMVAEDMLDSPLAALGLLKENDLAEGRSRDRGYVVDGGRKPTLSDEVFRFAMHDWWARAHRDDEMTSYRETYMGENSPGRVFRLPERDVQERLQRLVMSWPKEFSLTESNHQRMIRREKAVPSFRSLLRDIYQRTN
jgi:hypothetical protein